jgi:hypothetical protein
MYSTAINDDKHIEEFVVWRTTDQASLPTLTDGGLAVIAQKRTSRVRPNEGKYFDNLQSPIAPFNIAMRCAAENKIGSKQLDNPNTNPSQTLKKSIRYPPLTSFRWHITRVLICLFDKFRNQTLEQYFICLTVDRCGCK